MNDEIPSYAPSQGAEQETEQGVEQKPEANNDDLSSELNDRQNENKEFHSGQNNNNIVPKNKKSKKFLIPIIIVIVLGLVVESYFFFIGNKNTNTINSYNYWFSSVQPSCDTNVQTNKPNTTEFFNQICGTANNYKYVNANTNIEALVDGAIESYTIIYKNDSGDQIKLIASSFNDTEKQSEYFNNEKKDSQNYVWQNKSAVYVAIGNDAVNFAKALNV